MNNKKRIIICLFVVCLTFLFSINKVAGLAYDGEATSSGDVPPSPGNHGYAACNAQRRSKTSDAGLLISIVRYDAETNKTETIKSKIVKTGNWGKKTINFKTRCTQEVKRKDHVATGDTATSSTACGNEHTVEDVVISSYSITYAAPQQFSPAVKKASGTLSVSQSPPSFTGGGLKRYVETYLLDALFPTDPNKDHVKENIRAINETMGLNLEYKDYVKLYIKVEPIYRVDPGLKGTEKPSGGGYSPTSTQTSDCLGTGHTYSKITTCSAKVDGSCPNGTSSNSNCASDTPCAVTTSKNCQINWLYTSAAVTYAASDHSSNIQGSYITTARENSGNTSYMVALFSSKNGNDHDTSDENGKLVKNAKDYYVGYHYQNAIAFADGYHKYKASEHPYKLVSNINNAKAEYDANHNVTLGMAIYSLLRKPIHNPNCKSTCEKYDKNHANDAYLECASNYCDSYVKLNANQSATIAKRDCILNKDMCDYNPAKPKDCNNTTMYKAGAANNASSCGYTDTTQSKKIDESSGSYQFCERQGTDFIENRNDGKEVYAYQDSNSYLNVACKETATASFTDLSKNVLRPSQAISYGGSISANRECTVFFDTVSWKLDFASTHANDSTRKLIMLNKLRAFNLQSKSNSETDTVNGSEMFQKEGYSIVDENKNKMTLNELEGGDQGLIVTVAALQIINDADKTSAKTTVEEVVNNKKSTKGMDAYGGEITLKKLNNDPVSKTKNTNSNADKVKLVLDYDESKKRNKSSVGERTINNYVYKSGFTNIYALPDVCIRDDGTAKVELLANGKNECSSYISNNSYEAKRNYYISASATPNRKITDNSLKHQFITTVSVNENRFQGVNKDKNYFTDKDICEYKVDDQSIELSIWLDQPEDSSPCDDIYEAVTAHLSKDKVDLSEEVTIKSYGIQDITGKKLGQSSPNNKEEVVIGQAPMTITETNGEIKVEDSRVVEGVIEDSKGNRYYTQRTVQTLGKSTNACSITISGTRVKISAPTSIVYYAVTNNTTADGRLIWTKVNKSSEGISFNIFDTIPNVYVGIKKGNKLELCAEYTEGVKCDHDCHKEIKNKNDYKEVKDYCRNYWKDDSNNPTSETACFSQCSSGCPISCDKKTIKSWCTSNWSKENYKDQPDCESTCMQGCVREGDLTYRPINEYNPFPYSETSNVFGYNTGDRLIGKNWTGKEHLITDNASQNYTDKPLYEVDLSITDIAAIRNDTKTYYDRDIDPYMSRQTYSQSSRCLLPDANGYIYKGYCSALIHDSAISSKFTKVRGV